jgi:ribosomal protein L15
LEALNLEIREDGKRDKGDGDVNTGALATLNADKLRLGQELRRAQMAAEQAEATVKKTNELCDKLLAENTQLKTDVQVCHVSPVHHLGLCLSLPLIYLL